MQKENKIELAATISGKSADKLTVKKGNEIERVFLIVLDSFGIGELPDACEYGDEGSNTLRSVSESENFRADCLNALGLFRIDGVREWAAKKFPADSSVPLACYARLAEKSKGKDTTTGHWELAGVISRKPFPVYPKGFPKEIVEEFKKRTGREILCNLPYSGTKVIEDYGEEHLKTGALIVYTSADSVFQIAAHEEKVPVETLYGYCRAARELLGGEHAVGRVIARPFAGTPGAFYRTERRHDFSLEPSGETLLDICKREGLDVLGVGKISDIFAGRGLTENLGVNRDNADGMRKTENCLGRNFKGLCFVNLVDFDMVYGHRNDADGYAAAISRFDVWLKEFLPALKDSDVLAITADHGCDPATPSTDHSREYVPLLMYGRALKRGVNLGTRSSFADLSATILDVFGLNGGAGESFLKEILK